MKAVVHPTAVVDESAVLEEDCVVGPFCVVGPDVHLGAGTCLQSHVVVERWTTIGQRCRVSPFAVLGGIPQDRKYRDERSELIIGDDVLIREHVTVHRGTAHGLGYTTIGDRSLLMASTHVAHDCSLAHDVVMTNGSTLAGHVTVEPFAVFGGFAAVGQMLRVGESAMLAAGAMVEQDAPPFCTVAGDRAKVRAVNVVGLRRRGFSASIISGIKSAFRLLFRSDLPIQTAINEARIHLGLTPELDHMLTFIEKSRRGVCR